MLGLGLESSLCELFMGRDLPPLGFCHHTQLNPRVKLNIVKAIVLEKYINYPENTIIYGKTE